MDYSKLTDAELEAIANNDYSKLSDATLQALSDENPPQEPPGMMAKAGQVAGGVVGTAADLAQAAYGAVPYKELLIPYAGYKALPHVWEGTKRGAQMMGNFMGGATTAPGPVSAIPPGATSSPSWTAPAQPAQQPSQISQAQNIVRKLALDKLLKGAVGVGALTYSGGLNTNEDEELRRRRAMPPTITR